MHIVTHSATHGQQPSPLVLQTAYITRLFVIVGGANGIQMGPQGTQVHSLQLLIVVDVSVQPHINSRFNPMCAFVDTPVETSQGVAPEL